MFSTCSEVPKGHNMIPHTSSDTEPLGLCLALHSITLKCPEFLGLVPAGSCAWLSLPFLSCLTSVASSSSDSIPSGSTDSPKCFRFLLGLSVLERSQRETMFMSARGEKCMSESDLFKGTHDRFLERISKYHGVQPSTVLDTMELAV